MEVLNTKSFNKAISEGVIIIDFYAPWCGPCIAFAPTFEKFGNEFKAKATFYKVDIDQDGQIASDYAVMSIPTIIAFNNGEEISRKVGSMNEIDFRIWLNRFLA